MIWTKWLPMRYIIRRAARSQGFLDPIELMARLRRFAQPSEVAEPVELLRAGVVFHARGLINSKVVQHNLDWVWPYWIERQFDPRDESFIPRAFSFSHINLTHRNWTAIGLPDWDELPLVDPRGLLTPLLDGWSLDAWLLTPDHALLPSRALESSQEQHWDEQLAIVSRCWERDLALRSRAWVELQDGRPVCRLSLSGEAGSGPAWLALALRPQNPEGVSFIHQVALRDDRRAWTVDDKTVVCFDRPAELHRLSDYAGGDVLSDLLQRPEAEQRVCDVGLVTGAALFPLNAGRAELEVSIPLHDAKPSGPSTPSWPEVRAQTCKLLCPEPRYQALWDAAVASLILHSPHDVYPGPYTYKRFWFRDAAFLIHALLCLGLHDRAERALARFPERQTPLGYFRSQEGEWDSNGEVLWILLRYQQLSGRELPEHWLAPIERGARWITRKRLDDNLDAPHAGLLPAGFSAEHLGPNDYYYWDDFWGISGLKAAARLCAGRDARHAAQFDEEAERFRAAVDRSLAACAQRLKRPAMPASPYRRMDAGAIGSLAVGYPLQDCRPDDPRLLDTVEFLLRHCFVDGAFFQDMIHSGLNAYLTLHVAQVLLRAGDPRYLALMDTVARIASPTGQWPEAIHPRTLGGCMGDGHHVWAAAEWLLMLRNCFVREEGQGLVLGAGIPARWLAQEGRLAFGPAPTSFGTISLEIHVSGEGDLRVAWEGEWRTGAPPIELRLSGQKAIRAAPGASELCLSREDISA